MSRVGNTVYVASKEDKKYLPLDKYQLPVTLKDPEGEYVVTFYKPDKYNFLFTVGNRILVKTFRPPFCSSWFFEKCCKLFSERKLERV